MTDKETSKSVTNQMQENLSSYCTEAENILITEQSGFGQESRDLTKGYGRTDNSEKPEELLFLSRLHSSELFNSVNKNKKRKVPGKNTSPSLQQMSRNQSHKRLGEIKEEAENKQWMILLVIIVAAVLALVVCLLLKYIHDMFFGLSLVVYLVFIIVIMLVIIKDILETITASMNDFAISLDDKALETKVRSITGLKGRKIRYSDVRLIKELDLEGCQIRNISALENFTNLKVLNLKGCQINDINALAELTNLKVLDLGECQIRDVCALSSLKKLTDLDLHMNQIRDISPLRDLTKLERLDLCDNQITDFSPIEELKIKDLKK